MIRFDSVTKTYQRGSAPALDDLTIEFERGEFAFLVGASGSGKSTMLRLILKETSPTAGRIFVAGKDLSRTPSWKVPALRRDIGMVFQDFRLLPTKTAYQNIEFALHVIGTPRAATRRLVPETLEMVGLADKGKRLPHELSGGEQQRVAIARAYVNRPRILLADEPTGNLDPSTAEGIMDLLDRINADGTTVLMATHDEKAVNRMGRRVVELIGGVVVRDEAEGGYRSSEAVNDLGEPVEADDPDAVSAAPSPSKEPAERVEEPAELVTAPVDQAAAPGEEAAEPKEESAEQGAPADEREQAPSGESSAQPGESAANEPAVDAPFRLDLDRHRRLDGVNPVRPQVFRSSAKPPRRADDPPAVQHDDPQPPVGPDLFAPASAIGAEDAAEPDSSFDDRPSGKRAFFPESRAQVGDVDTAWDDLDFGESDHR